MLYHGIDMVEVARVRRAAERWGTRFLQRVFTPTELEDCAVESSAPRYTSLAARWAAKEAAAKALGLGLSGLGAGAASTRRPSLRDIEVVRQRDGRPTLRLYGPAAAAADALVLTQLSLSLSHTRDYAYASVVALGAD